MKSIIALAYLLLASLSIAATTPDRAATAGNASDKGQTPATEKAKPAAGESGNVNAQKAPEEKVYWLTTKSGIRHNSKCRYYQNSHGQPCSKDEGRACKLCGG